MFHVKQKENKMYKIIFCDLDGTLLDDNRNVSDTNKNAIKKAIEKGCKFVICSGRSNMSIDHFNKIFDFDKIKNYAVAFNGAYIYETNTKEKLVEHLVPSNCAIKAINMCRKFDVDVMVYKNEMLYFDTPTNRTATYAKRNMVNTTTVDDLIDVASEPVSKVIIIGDNEELKKVENEVMTTNIKNEMTTFFSADILYEFNPIGIDKGTGLKELSKILNINIEETIAIGDNYNDLSMIKAAGLGVCCVNGENGVKNFADYITKADNNQGAVAEVINKFILN